jgi:hypothetical protein
MKFTATASAIFMLAGLPGIAHGRLNDDHQQQQLQEQQELQQQQQQQQQQEESQQRNLQVGQDVSGDDVNVIIGYKNGSTGLGSIASFTKKLNPKFKSISAVPAVVSKARLAELQSDPSVLYVEEDAWVYPNGEAIPFGLDMVQAESTIIPKSVVSGSSNACSSPSSFKIGIVDSGLAVYVV